MWKVVILPYGSDEFNIHLSEGWEPFATAVMPSPTSLAIPSNHSPLSEIMALVSLKKYVDERYIGEN